MSYPVPDWKRFESPNASLFPCVMSLNDALYAVGFAATEYRSGLTNPTPVFVALFSWHVDDALTSASMPAHIGAADEVPPIVVQPPNWALKMVIAPVNSSASALTSGSSRQPSSEPPTGLSDAQNW